MRDLSKSVRRAIREAASLAYRRQLEAELEELAQVFAQWKAGELNAFDVSDRIHEFHQGPSRDLFNLYQDSSMIDVVVAGALNAGLIRLEELGEAARGHISALAEKLRDVASER